MRLQRNGMKRDEKGYQSFDKVDINKHYDKNIYENIKRNYGLKGKHAHFISLVQ